VERHILVLVKVKFVSVLKVCDTEIQNISDTLKGNMLGGKLKSGTELRVLVFKCSLESGSCECKACDPDTRLLPSSPKCYVQCNTYLMNHWTNGFALQNLVFH
jgi:hypothetical protein